MNFSLVGQAKIGLMHQGGCLQSMLRALPLKVAGRQTPQFRVERNDQLGYCLVIADIEFTQEGRYIYWRIHKNLERDDRNHRGVNGHPIRDHSKLGNIESKDVSEGGSGLS